METPATSRARAWPSPAIRRPAKKVFYGEFLINAQGEDVVAGVRTPEPVANLGNYMPKAYHELEGIRSKLEKHFKDVQDFEFTIQDSKVFMLQTRSGKRTGLAAVRLRWKWKRKSSSTGKPRSVASRPTARPGARAGIRP
jgi:hypothetical protein